MISSGISFVNTKDLKEKETVKIILDEDEDDKDDQEFLSKSLMQQKFLLGLLL